MSEPKAYEVVPQVIIKENDAEGTPQSRTLQKEMKKNLAKREWVRAGELAANVTEVNYEGFARRTASFGVELDDEGKVKKTTEGGEDSETRLAERVGKVEQLARKFFEVGYDQLEADDKRQLRENVLNQAKRIPLLADRVQRAIDAGRGDELAERLIKDPTYSAELKNFINDQLEGSFDNLVIEKWEELREAEDEEEVVGKELEVIEAQLANAQSRLNSFKRKEDGSAQEGARGAARLIELQSTESVRIQQIADYEQQLIQAEQDVSKYEQDLNNALAFAIKSTPLEDPEYINAKKRISEYRDTLNDASLQKDAEGLTTQTKNRIQTILTTFPGEIKRMQDQIDEAERKAREAASGNDMYQTADRNLTEARRRVVDLRQNLARSRGERDELKALQEEERIAQENVKNLTNERNRILERQQEKTRNKQKAQREYEAAKEVRLSEERNLTVRLENAWGAAANAIIARQIEEGTKAYGEELEDLRKQSGSAHEEAVRVTLMNTWLGPEKTRKMEGILGKRKKETVRPMDKAQVLRDYNLLLTQGNEAFIRDIFKRTVNPDTGENFTDDEINDIYDKNPDLMNKMRPEATKQLLARKAMLGGFTPEDTYTLTATTWGQEAITKAYEQNATFREAVRRNFGEGALQRHGFFQRFGQEMAKHPFWWTLLLGIPAIFGTLGTEPERDTLDAQR